MDCYEKNNPEFESLEVHEQHGFSIIMLYQSLKSESGADYNEGDDGSQSFRGYKSVSHELGVPGDLFKSVFLDNIEELKRFTCEIDRPGQPHHNKSLETRMAVSLLKPAFGD
ncbi:hypothetical protein [Pseudomonas frederiksbergensis]|uniref:hypothetical protein n=1 Tax=Pseudomonas frederiksbergensis TaxID=104087 RepID=UPI003D1DC513